VKPYHYEIAYHAIAFANCFLRVEKFAREIFPDEIVQIVAEDNADARHTIKGVVQIIRTPARVRILGLDKAGVLPLERIHGPVLFAEKNESRPLQLADACAFLIRRRYYRHDEQSARFYDKLKPWMLMLPNEDVAPEPVPNLSPAYPFGPLVLTRS
jgi:hypothetical protein